MGWGPIEVPSREIEEDCYKFCRKWTVYAHGMRPAIVERDGIELQNTINTFICD